MIRIATPWLLIAIPALLVGGWFFFRGQKSRHTLRAICVALIILALAGVEIAVRTPKRNTAFLVDRSASVVRTTSDLDLFTGMQSLESGSARQSFALLEFAERAAFTSLLGDERPDLSTTRFETGGTNLGRAVELALATLPATDANQLVLLSDGQITDGLRDAIGAAQLAGVPISVLPIGETDPEDLALISLVAPTNVAPGQPFALEAEIEATHPMEATIAFYRDDELIHSQVESLPAGRSNVSYVDVISEANSHVYRAVVRGRGDLIPENDALSRLIRTSSRPETLLVDRGGTAVASLLEASGVEFTQSDEIPSLELLSEFRQLVLAGVPIDSLTAREVTDIERFARNLGGGVLAVLGEAEVRGFAPSPFEDLLPTSFAVPEREIVPSLAIVYILDRSSSMRALSGTVAKIRILRNAAAASLTLLPPETLVGVIAFDDAHQWIVPVSRVGNGTAAYGALQTIRAQGGTEMYEPLNDAIEALAQTEARSKHIILISDGRTADEGRDFAGLMDRLKDHDDITLSSIALGDSPYFELLNPLVEAGSGALYHVTDFLMLPQITMQITQRLSRSRFVLGDSPVTGSAIVAAGMDAAPDLSGYVLTFPRASAETALWVRSDPLFSTWQVGLGAVSALNTDLSGMWSAEWLEWPQLGLLFTELLGKTKPVTLASSGLYPSVMFEGAQTRITVDAREAEGDLLNFLQIDALLLPDETGFSLPQVGPGLYSASIPTPEEGGYALQLSEPDGGRSMTVPLSVPYPSEYRSSGVDIETLKHIAEMTGGVVLAEGDTIPQVDVRARARFVPIARELLLAALGLFLLDLLARKMPRRRRADARRTGSR